MNRDLFSGWDYPAVANFDLLCAASNVAKEPKFKDMLKKTNTNVHVGNVFSTDYFYHPRADEVWSQMSKHNFLGIEMESAVMYGMSHQHEVQSLTVLAITDEIHMNNYDPVSKTFADPANKYSFNGMSKEDRANKVDQMALLALKTAVRIVKGK